MSYPHMPREHHYSLKRECKSNQFAKGVWLLLALVLALGFAGERDRQDAEQAMTMIEEQIRVHPVVTPEQANEMAAQIIENDYKRLKPVMVSREELEREFIQKEGR